MRCLRLEVDDGDGDDGRKGRCDDGSLEETGQDSLDPRGGEEDGVRAGLYQYFHPLYLVFFPSHLFLSGGWSELNRLGLLMPPLCFTL